MGRASLSLGPFLLKVMLQCPHREWPPAASVPGAEKRVRAAVPGVRVEISTPPVPQPVRALGLLFPGLRLAYRRLDLADILCLARTALYNFKTLATAQLGQA